MICVILIPTLAYFSFHMSGKYTFAKQYLVKMLIKCPHQGFTWLLCNNVTAPLTLATGYILKSKAMKKQPIQTHMASHQNQ